MALFAGPRRGESNGPTRARAVCQFNLPLKLVRKALWRQPPDHPDVDPPHEALQVLEGLVEMGRLDEAREYPEDFREMLSASVSSARALEAALRSNPVDAKSADEAYARLKQSCNDCHTPYRNN